MELSHIRSDEGDSAEGKKAHNNLAVNCHGMRDWSLERQQPGVRPGLKRLSS
jgi:hypothetical protein